MTDKRSLFSGRNIAESTRSTGYKTTANAIAELVDNSIQANASCVKILVEVKQELRKERTRQSITRIGILDNGDGMTPELMELALVLGEGTHIDSMEGMGKYGMGLPQASMSQAQFISIWSWQNGTDSSYSTGFDLTDDEWRKNGSFIPYPEQSRVPDPWMKYADKTHKSGTLVVWAKTDRLSCSSANTLYDNSEFAIGRMYRKWIHEEKVKIEYITIEADTGKQLESKIFRAVDPLYLMDNTSVVDENPPVDPMFIGYEPPPMTIIHNGIQSMIKITVSSAKPEVRRKVGKQNAGNTPYGKHAGKNIGLSIIREGRELELDPNWTATGSDRKDPRHRWWGAQVEFGRDMDLIFGVTNNKQQANNLREAYNKSIEDMRYDDESPSDVRSRLQEDDPNLYYNLIVAEKIREMIDYAWSKVPEVEEDVEEEKKKPRLFAEKAASKATVEIREKEGITGKSDTDESCPLEERRKELKKGLEDLGVDKKEVDVVVKNFVDYGYKYHFVKRNISSSDAFFSVESEGGVLIIILNTAHPLYKELFGIVDMIDEKKEYTPAEQRELLINTYDSFKLMLAAWARMEDIAKNERRQAVINNRKEWGKIAQDFKGFDFDEQ